MKRFEMLFKSITSQVFLFEQKPQVEFGYDDLIKGFFFCFFWLRIKNKVFEEKNLNYFI